MHVSRVVRRACSALALAVVGGGLSISLAAAPAGATHNGCHNEPVPGDVWMQQTISGVGTVFVGADSGLNNPLVSGGVCVSVNTTSANASIGGSDADPARIGRQESVSACLAAGCPTPLVGPTGAEVGLPVVTSGSNLVCVGTICVRSTKVASDIDVYVLGTPVPVPACVAIGPGVTCP